MTWVVGLTGGIGSGKTAATDYLIQQGITVVDSDVIARAVVEPGQPAWQAIRDHFGVPALLPSGALNRSWLRQTIFDTPSERHWLEQQTHPRIRDITHHQLKSAQSDYAILASPLLFESQQTALVNRILVIDVPEALQLERASHRDGNSPEQIRQIINTQISRHERNKQAHDIVDNSGTLEALHDQLNALHLSYLETSARYNNSHS